MNGSARKAAVLAALLAGLAAQPGASFAQDADLSGRPVDAATRAMIEEIARKAAEVTGESGTDAMAMSQEAAKAMLERAQGAAAAVRAAGGLEGPRPLADALERARAAGAAVQPAPGPPAPAGSTALTLFVSWSMGSEALEEALRAAVADGHTRVVLRGVLPGERIGDAVRRIAPLIRDRVPGGSIDFDPPEFRHAGAFAVPTIFDPASGSQWRGSLAVDGFRRRLAAATARFSDAVGPTMPIAEPDLEEVMKAQAAGLDFSGMRDRAYRDWWRKAALVALPGAETSRERLVDPSVLLPAPLQDASGATLVPAGTRINALEVRPWSHRLIVFDATDPKQLAWAAARARENIPSIFLTSAVDRQAGWDGWQRLGVVLGAPLFVLEQQLAERLTVAAVPSVITQEGSRLRISEIGRDDLRADSQGAETATSPAAKDGSGG